jgi:hypothetical protein
MPAYEEKICPRCGCIFERKAGNILQCQCYGIQFSIEERILLKIVTAIVQAQTVCCCLEQECII